MAKGTGSSASTKRMQNMITQVNNNGDGNGDVLNPHIPPVQNLSEPGEHSAEEMKLMEGTTILPTLDVSSSPKLTSTLTKSFNKQMKKGVKHGVKKGMKTGQLVKDVKRTHQLQESSHKMMKTGVKTGVKQGKMMKTLTPMVKTTTGVKHGVKTGVKQGKKLAVAPLPRDKKSPKHEATHSSISKALYKEAFDAPMMKLRRDLNSQ